MKQIISFRSDLLALISVTLALIFALVAQAPRQAAAAQSKCQVCHNVKNPHTIEMPCKDVNKYLAQHPGDHAGPCQGISNERP
jgi:hypothetical protein